MLLVQPGFRIPARFNHEETFIAEADALSVDFPFRTLPRKNLLYFDSFESELLSKLVDEVVSDRLIRLYSVFSSTAEQSLFSV